MDEVKKEKLDKKQREELKALIQKEHTRADIKRLAKKHVNQTIKLVREDIEKIS